MSKVETVQGHTLPSKTLLKIGQVAQTSGLSVKTIRYYEDHGLLTPVVQRSKNGYRLFDPTIFNRLAFIRRAKSLGLSLSSIQEILEVHDQGKLPCGVVKDRLLAKLDTINQQIAALELLKTELQGILSGWQDQPPPSQLEQTICPNLQDP
ncbi:heavy metal-responsive transcriptional regulator [Spirulina subsalsa FACHB-351]|uniref:Heavy metal-responsive transcriptional regulator n=1 Tax=Spirulina subsalsa FACHB-351 TaxID=234711 RepID=A0ABT3KZY4_9CYAN|nr:heavy metal-responsive transcriptional regulator [Spirulina subsalsa]MCW6034786.1 heavy metal-responsive transcriptional regulator [Spirulina subsalsa FACHB-351]